MSSTYALLLCIKIEVSLNETKVRLIIGRGRSECALDET